MTTAEILEGCTDSNSTYATFKSLLERLSSTETRIAARQQLDSLRRTYEADPDKVGFAEKYHFSFHNIHLGSEQKKVTLLQLPSIFAPEEWSYTFFEGLSRYSRNDFKAKTVIELGCGNGWISIALAMISPLKIIYGLDINPRAITCAKINTFLNGLDHDGAVVDSGKFPPLWERIEFHVSDLLKAMIDKDIVADTIIGCIPQVLAPDPSELLKIAEEGDSDQALYDLSNYTAAYCYIEDHFGLGLIVKASEEAVTVMRAGGKLILNLGGRPGRTVLEGLFLRRGFKIKKVWGTKVLQAADTEIASLVAIEESSNHRFEFFMNQSSTEPIPASTAKVLNDAGSEIWHALTVYEATLPEHDAMDHILKFVKLPKRQHLEHSMDLSARDDSVFRERIRFLDFLARHLQESKELPYGETEGIFEVRKNICQFLKSYFRSKVQINQILIAPSLLEICDNLIRVYAPKIALVDGQLLSQMRGEKRELAHHIAKIIESPRHVNQLEILIKKLSPDLLITSISHKKKISMSGFQKLIELTSDDSCLLVVDLSDAFELTSQPETNPVFSLLADQPLPPHVIVICDLVKNQVYRDLQLSFLISSAESIHQNLKAAAELTYSRAPSFAQFYYNQIFADLLNFQLVEARGLDAEPLIGIQEIPDFLTDISSAAKKAFEHPAIARSSLNIDSSTTRLDYGENIFPISERLVTSVFEAFARKDISNSELDYEAPVKAFVSRIFTFTDREEGRLFCNFGSGVAPLFAEILKYMATKKASLIIPKGSYGEFAAAADFFQIPVIHCQTVKEHRFKYSPKALHEALSEQKNPWVFINLPCTNPTGAKYTQNEVCELLKVTKAHGATVIFDTTFAGLEFAGTFDKFLLSLKQDPDFVILTSMSKLFAAGGLRYGSSITNMRDLSTSMTHSVYRKPHSTVLHIASSIIESYIEQHPLLIADLAEQRLILKNRSELLASTLQSLDWETLNCEGGLFLLARPKFYGSKVLIDNDPIEIKSSNISYLLHQSVNLLVNSPKWTGIEGYCRFVFSVSDEEFQSAISALRLFNERLIK